jgi:hypothetical protein
MLALVALLAAAATPAQLPLRDRCEIARTILDAKGKRAEGMTVRQLRLIDEPLIAKRTTRGKTIVRGTIHRGKAAIPLFVPGETCGDQPFLLEHQEPALTNTIDPMGNHDLVIALQLYPSKQGYRFAELLRHSKHAYCSKEAGLGCYMTSPPARFEGTIAPKDGGGWTATVIYSLFAM